MDPMEDIVHEIDSTYYRGNRTYHKLCFIWPYTNPKIKRIGRIIYSINFIYAIYITGLATKRRVFVTAIDWAFAIQNLFELAFLSMIFCIYLIFISLEKQLKIFLEDAVTYWNSVTIPEQKELLIKMSKSHSIVIPFIKVAVFGSFWLFWLLPAIVPLILNIALPGEHNFTAKLCTTGDLTVLNPEKYFFFWFGYTYIIMTQAALCSASLCISAVFFISMNLIRFRLLSYRFSKLEKLVNSDSFTFDGSLDEYIHNEVFDLHRDHNECFDFFARVLNIGRKVLIILYTYSLIGSIFTGSMILFAKKINNVFLLLKMIVSFVFIVLYIFLISHFGQILADVSVEIFYESFYCGWYNFPLKTRSCILMIMLRASCPCEMKSGPITALKVNYESFSALMNTAVSYMTIMASLI